MTEPTQEQYANFGEAVAGILDGYLFEIGDRTEAERNVALAATIQVAAKYYGIEPRENTAS